MNSLKLVSAAALSALMSAPVLAEDWNGFVEGGLFVTGRTSTDTNIRQSAYQGIFLGTQTQRNFGDYRLSFDGRLEFIDDEGIDDVYETGPVHTAIIGLHFGREYGPAYFGGFAAAGYFDGYDSDSPMQGSIVGLEGSYDLGAATNAFAQLGYISAIGSPGDNEFKGYTARIGADHQVSDELGLGISAEFGRSPDCFVDCGDQPGEFISIALDGAYSITADVDMVARVSYARIADFDDDDVGTERNIYLGARWNIGDRSTQTALSTPMGGFQAAGWAHSLD